MNRTSYGPCGRPATHTIAKVANRADLYERVASTREKATTCKRHGTTAARNLTNAIGHMLSERGRQNGTGYEAERDAYNAH